MIVYSFDSQGVFSGSVALTDADRSPLEPGVFLVPGDCTIAPAPACGAGMRAVWGGGQWACEVVPVPPPPPPPPPFDPAAAALQIDEAVAAIYGRFTRFQLEYTEREAQAQAYKDAGYTGPVPPRVAEFATPAGMPAQAATDLILAQAVNLRTAQGELSALRMRKYEVLRAATDDQAQAFAAEILAGVAAVGANVS